MIELHTKIYCKCEQAFYHVLCTSLPLSQNVQAETICPFCGNKHTIAYYYQIDFPCKKKWWYFWKKHYIVDHFTKNEGNTDPESFHRKCKCGQQVLLTEQRRIIL